MTESTYSTKNKKQQELSFFLKTQQLLTHTFGTKYIFRVILVVVLVKQNNYYLWYLNRIMRKKKNKDNRIIGYSPYFPEIFLDRFKKRNNYK